MKKVWIKASFVGILAMIGMATAAMAAEVDEYGVTKMDTIVVTGSRMEESLRDVTSNITIITQEEIEAFTAQNMSELMAQNGFYTIDQGSQFLVQIRGMHQPSLGNEMRSPILVLLNGRRIGANNALLMGLANLERIEIVRGPSAVQYGPSAMGGVINIITKRGLQDDFSATMEAGIGSFGLHKESLSVNGVAKGVDFALGVVNYARDDFDMYDGQKRPKSAISHNTNVNFDLGYNFNEVNRIGANINYYGMNIESGPSYSNRETYTSWSDYKVSNYNMAFMYDGGTLDRMFNWSATYSFGKDKSNAVGRPGMAWIDDNKIDVRSANAQIGYNGDFISVNLGSDYIQYDYKGTYLNEGLYRDFGIYLASKVRFFDEKVIFSLGGRYDNYKTRSKTYDWNSSDNNFLPSAGIAYIPVKWLKLRTNYSEGFRMPTPEQISGSSGWTTYISNSNLKPEKSKTWEMGADVNWQFINAGLTYFHTDYRNKIVAQRVNPAEWQWQNLEGAILSGLEFALSADIGKAFNWQNEVRPYVNFTYMIDRKNNDPATKSATDTVPSVPDWLVNFGLAFANTEYDLKANINAFYSGTIRTQDYRGGAWPAPYTNHTGDLVVNLSVEKGLFKIGKYGSIKLRANVNNFFDSKNEAFLDYNGPGRNFYLGLVYTY